MGLSEKEKILIVEDDKLIRHSLFEILTFEGFECIEADSGADALEKLKDTIPDLIISDIMMPEIDGYELFQKVKEKQATMFVPFLFLTAKADELSVRKGMNLGVDDYIKKPFNLEDLLISVKTRLEKKRQIDSTINRLGQNIAKYVPHELKTPLVSIIGNSNLLLDYYDSLKEEEKKELIESINRSGYRLLARIERFLLYSELEITPKDVYLSSVNKYEKIDPSLYDFIELSTKTIECSDRINDLIIEFESIELNIFERDFLFIVIELITNACKFSEKGSPITVTGKKQKDNYLIKVEDKGCGIPIEELNVFRAYQQINKEENQQIGNGLGLTIINKLSKIYNLRFYLQSRLGKFTIANIEIPLKNNGMNGI